MNKYRFKSENHKQEFLNNCWDSGQLDETYNQAVIDFLDSEGLEEFYVGAPEDYPSDFCLMDENGDIEDVIHNGIPLLFHFYPEDVHHYLSVV